MLSMRIDSMVSAMVNRLLAGGRDNEALYFNFDLRRSYYQKTNNGSSEFGSLRGLHLLYYLPEGHSYINVFSAVTDSPFDNIGEVTAWKHECTQCWRDINTFSTTYFSMAKEINAALVREGFDEVPPSEMCEHNYFSMIKWVKAKVEKDPSDDLTYRRLIHLL